MECADAAGTLTHLVAVVDTAQNRLRLYVNGQYVASASYGTHFNASGPLRVGSGWTGGAPADPWRGRIDDVQVFTGTLTDTQVLYVLMGFPLD